MRHYKSVSAVLFFLLCSIASTTFADVIVYTEKSQHKPYFSSGATLYVRHSSGLAVHALPIGQEAINNIAIDNLAINNLDGKHVVVVNKLATYWVKPAYGAGRIRVTVPMQFYLTSWDVKALERELERLGVKVRPKPLARPGPKPGPVVSG